MVTKGVPVIVEADIKSTYTPMPPMFNVVGEIRGTDKAEEVVMLGAHFDSWHASTGATDNAAGSAAMLEAMRILKVSGVKLRRTVRIGLWTGEEQGLIGSARYVATHFGGGRGRGAAVPPTPPTARTREVRRLLQYRQRHRRDSRRVSPEHPGGRADLPRVDGAVQEPRHDASQCGQHRRHRPRLIHQRGACRAGSSSRTASNTTR